MLIAKELLEAFRDSFLNHDSEPLVAVTTPISTITFTSTGETLNHREMLDWAKSCACYLLQDFVILKDGEGCIAGTHSAKGKDSDGHWHAKCFFFANIRNGKIVDWYVHARPIAE